MKNSTSWIYRTATWRGIAVLCGVFSVVSTLAVHHYIVQHKPSWWTRLKETLTGKRFKFIKAKE